MTAFEMVEIHRISMSTLKVNLKLPSRNSDEKRGLGIVFVVEKLSQDIQPLPSLLIRLYNRDPFSRFQFGHPIGVLQHLCNEFLYKK